MPVQLNSEPRPLVHMEGRQETPVGESCISFFIWYAQENKIRYGIIRQTEFPFGKPHHHCIPFPRVRPAQYSRFRSYSRLKNWHSSAHKKTGGALSSAMSSRRSIMDSKQYLMLPAAYCPIRPQDLTS